MSNVGGWQGRNCCGISLEKMKGWDSRASPDRERRSDDGTRCSDAEHAGEEQNDRGAEYVEESDFESLALL